MPANPSLRERLARAFALRRAYEMSFVALFAEGPERDAAAERWVDREWHHFVLQADAALQVFREWLESEATASMMATCVNNHRIGVSETQMAENILEALASQLGEKE